MHSTTLCALTVVLTLTSVDHCQGTACYECNTWSEYGCLLSMHRMFSKVLICGSDSSYNLDDLDVDTLTEMVRTFNEKKTFYENKEEYIVAYLKLNTYIEGIQEVLDEKSPPPPNNADQANNTYAKMPDDFYNLGIWGEDLKYDQYWDDVVKPQLTKLKAAWKGKKDMPDPPPWSRAVYEGSVMKFPVYKEIIDQWLVDANATIQRGRFTDGFHQTHRHKWVDITNKNLAKMSEHKRYKREVPPNDRPILPEVRANRATAFPDLPIDETWCVEFKSPSLGVQRGCGVQLKGFVFKEGCHTMSEPYEDITYCRCANDPTFSCPALDQSSNDVIPPNTAPPGMIPPGTTPPNKPSDTTPSEIPPEPIYSDSARSYPCLLLIVITLYATLTA